MGRVLERRRAVALARHYREFEGLSIREIADRLGRSPATIKTYFYDPTGEKARAVKARYQGVCRGCGAYTQPRNGKGDAYAYCKVCHPGAIERRWTRARVQKAMCAWETQVRPAAVVLRLVACRPVGRNRWPLTGGRLALGGVIATVVATWTDARTAASPRDAEEPTPSDLTPRARGVTVDEPTSVPLCGCGIGEYGVSWIARCEPCLRAGAGICRPRRSRGSQCPERPTASAVARSASAPGQMTRPSAGTVWTWGLGSASLRALYWESDVLGSYDLGHRRFDDGDVLLCRTAADTDPGDHVALDGEIGRTSCRERV